MGRGSGALKGLRVTRASDSNPVVKKKGYPPCRAMTTAVVEVHPLFFFVSEAGCLRSSLPAQPETAF